MPSFTQRVSEWIAKHVTDPTGRCAEITLAMNEEFPELRRVRGHYFCPILNNERPHWWLEDSAGEVIDPTAAQFPSLGHGIYEEHSGPEPTGKCPNCGGYVYDGGTVCSDACARSYEAYCLRGW
jgi:hypothetical protein